ncbi:hypothetical protein KAU85_00880 [Candidatus Bathyarchaeota archaeon]|nr:hypothetical protein [Candidatus Bathyarchaeota archaeon]MCK4482505.1 hypothetical protein [Candidatus Bathyarchaeota archaeon]
MLKRNKKKLDLLEMSGRERTQLIKEIRGKLRKKVVESKLQQMLLEAENVTVNGHVVYDENQQLSGLCLNRTRSKPHFYSLG